MVLALEHQCRKTADELTLAKRTIEMLTAELERLVGENRKLKGD